jgi:hypothetical protein
VYDAEALKEDRQALPLEQLPASLCLLRFFRRVVLLTATVAIAAFATASITDAPTCGS